MIELVRQMDETDTEESVVHGSATEVLTLDAEISVKRRSPVKKVT